MPDSGLQRFTAGKGIVHSEMPSAEGAARGIQMWVNLPASLKKIEPEYQQVDAASVPQRDITNGVFRVLSGEGSPLKLDTPVIKLDVQLDNGGELDEPIPEDYRGLVYVVDGACDVNGNAIEQGGAVFIQDQGSIKVRSRSICRLMLCFGRPHGEPIHQHGPFVD